MSRRDIDLVSANAPPDPEQLEAAAAPEAAELSPATALGPVHLSVAALERSIDYYRAALGLTVLDRTDGRASVGREARELLVLVEEPGAMPSHGYTGLYHFALLVPERRDLARWLAHAARARIPLVGLSDHFVSEAIYLADPDGNGVELYWDRPKAQWPVTPDGRLAMKTDPLDVRALLREADRPA